MGSRIEFMSVCVLNSLWKIQPDNTDRWEQRFNGWSGVIICNQLSSWKINLGGRMYLADFFSYCCCVCVCSCGPRSVLECVPICKPLPQVSLKPKSMRHCFWRSEDGHMEMLCSLCVLQCIALCMEASWKIPPYDGLHTYIKSLRRNIGPGSTYH